MNSSATQVVPSGATPRERFRPSRPAPLWALSIATTLGALAAITAGISYLLPETWSGDAIWLAALVIVVNLVPVSWGATSVDLDLPLLLAGAFVFGPVPAGIVTLVASNAPEDFSREVPLVFAIFNRGQKALSVMAAGVVFGGISQLGTSAWLLIFAATLGVLADLLINTVLTAFALHLGRGIAMANQVRAMLFVGKPGLGVAYLGLGLTSLLVAVAYEQFGAWAFLLALAPIAIARLAFLQTQELREAGDLLLSKDRVLARMSDEIVRERADERLTIAAALHDDVIQSLHFLTLHAQVIREDLRAGRLLQLEEDIPALLSASQETAQLTRTIVGELRRSPLGRGGLDGTLASLVRNLAEEFPGEIQLSVDSDSGMGPVEAQVLAYQVIREAATNAVKHSDGSLVRVWVGMNAGALCASVTDNGRGFDPEKVDGDRHFGLTLMSERARVLGVALNLESEVGRGTRVSLAFPANSAHA